MTTFTIDTNDKTVIEKAKKLLIDNLHLQVKIKEEGKKNKWSKIADEIKGKMSVETSEYLQECSKEFRNDFSLREYN